MTLSECGVSKGLRYEGLQAAPRKRMLKERMTVAATTANDGNNHSSNISEQAPTTEMMVDAVAVRIVMVVLEASDVARG